LRGPFGTYAHNFCIILKNIRLASEFIQCSSSGSSAFKENNAKTNFSQKDPAETLEKWGLEAKA